MTTQPQRQVVGAVVAREDGSVLLLRRKPDDFMGGIYELPSGMVETGEELEQALHREVLEETGLTVSAIHAQLPSFDYRSKSGRETRQFNYVVAAWGPEVVLTEHDDYRWASSSDVTDLNVSSQTRAVLANFWHTKDSSAAVP